MAGGSRQMDRLHPPLHAPKNRRFGQAQIPAAHPLLADAIHLGLSKMAESCSGTPYAKRAWLQAWHVRDETYSAALAALVNAQFRHPFAGDWGDGSTASSDGQRFRVGGHAERGGNIHPK